MAVAKEIDISMWAEVGKEPMGEPGNVWVEEPPRWLFKPARLQHDPRGEFVLGDGWAEAIASRLAKLIDVPAAHVEFAHRHGQMGSLSKDIVGGRGRLSLGNEVLRGGDPTYPASQMHTVPEYTLARIFDALDSADIRAHPELLGAGHGARSQFAGFLVLDAWLANQDRHHGNWGVLENLSSATPSFLGPSFDHGCSLGFQLHDDEKLQRIEDGSVVHWARRGKCRPMGGRPNLVGLALEAVRKAGPPGETWLARLASVSADQEESIVAVVPKARMSYPSRRFACAVLDTNRRRLLDGY